MKTLILTLASIMAFASTSYSKEINMVCMTGDSTDMDLKIESQDNGNEKLSVILTGMDGETVQTFVNSGIKNSELTRSLEAGKVDAMVSKSDLGESFGGAYFDAGIITMVKSAKGDGYKVEFAANSNVYLGECSPK